LLHDVLEDTRFTYADIHKLFGYKVASLVEELTNDPKLVKMHGKAEYLLQKMVGMTSYALVIKLADTLHNLEDIDTAEEKFRKKFIKRVAYIMDNLGQYRILSKTHLKLIALIKIKLEQFV
jgi:GTP pyrophosphokinase